MGFLQKLKNGAARFMYGRNGVDQMGLALLWGYVGVCLARTVLALLHLSLPAAVCDGVMWVLLVLILFRMLSKNLYKRREENSRWLQFWWKLKNGRNDAKARHADKEHRYFTCKKCRTICRVPVGKGKVEITCPKCGEKIRGKT